MINYFTNLFTVYTTTKVVGVRSPIVAVVHFVLVLLVWCALLASLRLDIRKIYQKTCPVNGVVLTKVKGFASTENLTDEELDVINPQLYKRTWDPADIVYPAQGGEGETGSFAIVTNLLITPNQTLGSCADGSNSNCENDSDCQVGFWSPATNGVYTGRCLKDDGSCEIRGWCPIEKGKLPMQGKRALLEDVQDFTVMLKNTVEFPGCDDPHVRNLPSYLTRDFLRKCRYNRVSNPLCPIFRIGDIISWSGDNFTTVAVKGGVYRIKVKWVCDLDFGKTVQDCRPKYKFLRVDEREASMFSGWNFRSAVFYSEDRRILRKQFATKILIDLEGEGRKFDFFQLIIKFGATIGLFSVATLACNFLLSILNKMGKAKGCLSNLSTNFHDDNASRFEVEAPKDVFVDKEEQSGNRPCKENKTISQEYYGNKAFSGNAHSLNNHNDSFKSISE